MERIDPVHGGHFDVSGKTRWFGNKGLRHLYWQRITSKPVWIITEHWPETAFALNAAV